MDPGTYVGTLWTQAHTWGRTLWNVGERGRWAGQGNNPGWTENPETPKPYKPSQGVHQYDNNNNNNRL